jgi:hypothetical protein
MQLVEEGRRREGEEEEEEEGNIVWNVYEGRCCSASPTVV